MKRDDSRNEFWLKIAPQSIQWPDQEIMNGWELEPSVVEDTDLEES